MAGKCNMSITFWVIQNAQLGANLCEKSAPFFTPYEKDLPNSNNYY